MRVVHPGKPGQAVVQHTHTPVRRISRMNVHKNALLTPHGRVMVVRCERERIGELTHMGSQKLWRLEGTGRRITGRTRGGVNRLHGIGWEGRDGWIDDATRLASSEILAD